MYLPPYTLLTASLCLSSVSAFAQNACDLNQDGAVNIVDVQLAINMSIGRRSCTANIIGPGVCNSIVVARVKAAALGGACNTHYVTLSWVASMSDGIVGYNVYRSTTSSGPYAKVNVFRVGRTTYTDFWAVPGATYYYVTTALDGTNTESAYSNEVKAVIPTP